MVEDADDGLHAALHRALEVGVLDAQEKDAAALVGQTLADDGAEQVAQMHKAGGAWRDAGDLCALRQAAGRVHRFDVRRGGGDIREKQVCKTLIIHVFDLSFVLNLSD